MKSDRIKSLLASGKAGDMVEVSGWVRTRRDSSGGFSFLEINDGSAVKNIQVVADNTLENYSQEILNLKTGAGLTIKGKLKESEGKEQNIEIYAEDIKVHCFSDSDFPLQKKRHSLEYLRSIAHLRPRTNTFGAVTRIRSAMSFAIHKFFNERNFLYIHTPIITASDCEGAGEMFRVTTLDLMNLPKNEGSIDFSKDFFAKPSFLTVSGQLEGEIFASAVGDIYTFGPTFRAENSNTSRHLSEFWMIEPEMAFCDIQGNMDVAEDFIKYIIKYVLENNSDDMEFFDAFIQKGIIENLKHVVNSNFERLTYSEAISLLENSGENFEFPVKWGVDLQSEHERYLSEKKLKKPVILTDYPKDIKAFYMRQNEDGKTVRAMDVLVPGIGEIIGGSQREERYDVLIEKIKSMGLREEDYWWYLELRKFGSVPHAGFGLGFERMIQYVSGIENIRDVIPFPRYPGHAEF